MLFNFELEVAMIAMTLAQLLKLPIQYLFDKKWTPMIIFSTGGMPSSHSAFVTALTLSIALIEGVETVGFAISFVFAGVVIHDAIGIRREAGKHASVLNDMQEELKLIIDEVSKGEERDQMKIDTNLKELLGHEPIEAVSGVLLGVVVTLFCYFMWFGI